MTRPGTVIAAALIASVLRVVALRAADDPVARAKELYLAAAYEEALTILDSIPSTSPPDVGAEAARYRVFCLLALDRRADADAAIQAIVAADPFYTPSNAQASPRIQAIFGEVRRAMLPSMVERLYNQAKEAFDRKAPGADAQFERVLALLEDPGMAGRPTTADLRTLVTGFRDLARARVLTSTSPPSTSANPAVATTSEAEPAEAVSGSFVAPAAVEQRLPPWRPPNRSDRRPFTGTLLLQIDATGAVTSAKLLAPIYPSYDSELLKSALSWKFTPATRNGVPIPWSKSLTITLRP